MSQLDAQVEKMRTVAAYLIPLNFPKGPAENEDIISPLKKSIVEVDGYTLGLHFNKAEYPTYLMETVQIFGVTMPFLPFSLVVKVARKFLGNHYLSYIEAPKEDRRYYCWTVCVDQAGHPIKPQYEVKTESVEYDGFPYTYMNADQFNFY